MTSKSPVQVTVQRGSFNITLSGEDVSDVVKQAEEVASVLVEKLVVVDQALLAQDVGPSVGTVVGTPERSLSVPPPPASGVPECKHGAMQDLRGKIGKNGEPYKYSFYCPLKTDNWKDKCKPLA